MSLDAAYLGANIAMILGVLTVAVVLTFVGTYSLTKARHPAQEETLAELERARQEVERLSRCIEKLTIRNRELAAASHQSSLMLSKANQHDIYSADYRRRAEDALRDVAYLETESQTPAAEG